MGRAPKDWERRIGLRVRLRDLHILSTVVDLGGMAKAAKRLGLSQPAVSEAITNLEAAVGARLLDRGSRGTEPTIYSRGLLKRWRVVFDELRQGIQDIEFLSDPTVGEVRVGCPEGLMAGFTPAVIERLSRQHPKILAHLVLAETATLELRQLRERKIDLVIGRIAGAVVDDELDVEILIEEQYVVVAGAGNPWARRRNVTLPQLMNEAWIHWSTDTDIGALIADAFKSQGADIPPSNVTTFSIYVRERLLASGRYLTVLPNSTLQFLIKGRQLKVLPIKLDTRPRYLAIITLKNRTMSPAVNLFIEHARAVAKSIPPAAV
jgi:DNA-binding transcriptional LysR family regulator